MNLERIESGPGYMAGYASATDYQMSMAKRAEALAVELVTGENTGMTVERYADWLATATEKREPMRKPSIWLRGPVSNAELLKLTLNERTDDFIIAAACRELRERYLKDSDTLKLIRSLANQIAEAA